jgi:nicotinic acid mononucleotide adenylyltransferase
MNKISYILVNEILKDNTTLIYGGGFKPPTKGHLAVVKQSLEKYPQVNKYIIFVGSGTRDGITQDQAVQIWNIYKKYLPVNMEVIPVPSPIKSVFDYSKENPDENIIWVIGGRQGNEDDLKDFVNRTKTIEKYPNITATNIITPISNISGTKARQALKSGDKSEIITYFPSDISDQDIEKIIDITSSSLIKEAEEFDRVDYYTSFITNVVPSNFNVFREENRIIVDNILNDTQENVAPNHKGKSSPYGSGYKKLNENTIPSIDVMQKCAELTQHMIEKGFNIKPLPSVKFIGDDVSNAENFLGKTAHYDPNKKTIVVYTYGRHPKDIVRSFSHEMIHHMQNIEGRLGDISTTNTLEDDHINNLEKEANLKGTMTFRNWTDSLNEKKNKDPFGINQYARELAQGLEEQSQNYVIYCDMDGVIADFDKRFRELAKMSPDQYEQKYGIEQFWNFIDNKIGVRFWVGIPWMQDGKQLWEHIKKYKPTLLSAPSRNNESRLGKRLWVKKHIPGAKLILASRANKQDYSKPNAILIDDRPDTIIEWENKGGIGILHKSAEETIQKLKSLGL